MPTSRAGHATEAAWRSARSWYRRSAEQFGAMRRRDPLTLAFVPDTDAVRDALAPCDRELGDARVR